MALLVTLVGLPSHAPARSGASNDLKRAAALAAHLLPGQRVPNSPEIPSGTTEDVSYYNWSGYADDNSAGATYTHVAGKWVQPTVKCLSTEDETAVFWVGLDGFSDSTVEQDGTEAYCQNGTASYYTWWEMYPTNDIEVVGSSVQPGDAISSSVNFANGKYTLAVTDTTNPSNSFSVSEKCGSGLTCANASAEWIAETPGYARGDSPWPSYGKWTVSSASVTSSTGGMVPDTSSSGVISSFPDDQITIVGNRSEPLATTGSLTTSGAGFPVTWAYTW
jgi:hypothetical protein